MRCCEPKGMKTSYVPAVWQRPVIPTLKVEAGGPIVQGHPWLLEAGLPGL